MLCRKFKNILFTKSVNSHVVYRPLVPTRSFSKWFDVLSGPNMTSAIRMKIIRDLILSRFLNGLSRNNVLSCMVKRCRTDKGVRDVLQYFREVFFRPRKMHILVTASVFKKTEEKSGPPKKCSKNIKNKDMEKLISDLEGIEELSRATLYCEGCSHRIVIDNKQPGVRYCGCPHTKPTEPSFEGWVPYMEAPEIIIWRKEYKSGGLYAYKVYGRYKHIHAEDFARIQIDGQYRSVWDSAVASLSVVENEANGVPDQCVLHWEVLWPRLFANRDYVFLRRHTKFTVHSRCLIHKDGIFEGEHACDTHTHKPHPISNTERPNVHSTAKQISLENEMKEAGLKAVGMKAASLKEVPKEELKENTVYVIVSRSCVHPQVPETNKAVRVMEYWSHMVVTTLNGPDQPGMEFVLTYYDEPSVGGLPTAVTAWAMGRAGPAFLERMRSAAQEYTAWRSQHSQHETIEFLPAIEAAVEKAVKTEKVSLENQPIDEQDMETCQDGPDIMDPDCELDPDTKEQATQTRPVVVTPVDPEPGGGPCVEVTISDKQSCDQKETLTIEIEVHKVETVEKSERDSDEDTTRNTMLERDVSKSAVADKLTNVANESERSDDDEKEEETKNKWWRYLYPLYYFV